MSPLRNVGRIALIALATFAAAGPVVLGAEEAPAPDLRTHETQIAPLMAKYCAGCHNAEKHEADLNLRTIDANLVSGRDGAKWTAILDRLQQQDMPPPKSVQPTFAERNTLIEWIVTEKRKLGPNAVADNETSGLPQHGNRVDHSALFDSPAGPVVPPRTGRVWLMSPTNYMAFVTEVAHTGVTKVSQPFAEPPGRGFKDYAGLSIIDEPTTEVLYRNAEAIVERQSLRVTGKDGKINWAHDTQRAFVPLFGAATPPTEQQVRAAIGQQFHLALSRPPTAPEANEFLALYQRNVAQGGQEQGSRATLAAILMLPEAVFRMEATAGAPDEFGRPILSPRDIARAISYTLGDKRERGLYDALAKGGLTKREEVVPHVERILRDPKIDKPRLLRFFREYFGYGRAFEVFKDPKDIKALGLRDYRPLNFVEETDRLVNHILARDKEVLRELLTTDRGFVRSDKPYDPKSPVANNRFILYNLSDYPTPDTPQPLKLPGQRAGILTQPSWLIAWSTNFENDPVRRGRWVRERLLGGVVPELPIGIDATIPEDETKTFRERLELATTGKCMHCHQRMNGLGLPFEQYDHFGRLREQERDRPVVTSGSIDFSGDAQLDGPVADPVEMIHRLADSPRVRQVFVRHAFRFFLGRNETLGDAKTLQDADKAYVASGGSFQALVVSLVSSDSFLLRQVESTESVKASSRSPGARETNSKRETR